MSAAKGGVWRDASVDDGGGLPHARPVAKPDAATPTRAERTSAMRKRAYRAKIAAGVEPKPKGAPWSDRDVAFLRKHYLPEGAAWCALRLGRSASAVRNAARARGITVLWSAEEIATLRVEWGELRERGLRRKLPGRTWWAIAQKAHHLGLANPNQGVVSIEEACRRTGMCRKRLRKILAERGVTLTHPIRTFVSRHARKERCTWVVDPDAAAEAVEAWLKDQASRLRCDEAAQRAGVSTTTMKRAMRLLAATRPVEGHSALGGRVWAVRPEDADAAMAMWRERASARPPRARVCGRFVRAMEGSR